MNRRETIEHKILGLLVRYKDSILSGMIIVLGIYFSIRYFGTLKPEIAAVGGLLFSIPVKLFWKSYMMPVLKIKNIDMRQLLIPPIKYKWRWIYYAIIAIVKNNGRSAAKNCKGYIVLDRRKRVYWEVSSDQPNAVINSRDEEILNLFAISSKKDFK